MQEKDYYLPRKREIEVQRRDESMGPGPQSIYSPTVLWDAPTTQPELVCLSCHWLTHSSLCPAVLNAAEKREESMGPGPQSIHSPTVLWDAPKTQPELVSFLSLTHLLCPAVLNATEKDGKQPGSWERWSYPLALLKQPSKGCRLPAPGPLSQLSLPTEPWAM